MSEAKVVAVVVTYNPGPLGRLLEALAAQCAHTIVVDNGSAEPAPVARACTASGAEFVALGENLGIAAAQNRGIARARELGAAHVLLMDHDSIPAPDMVARLLAALEADSGLAAAGPLAAEEREGADQLVYVARTWKPGRATQAELDVAAASPSGTLEAAFLIASGCLIRIEALDEVGGMREELFIDHVDLEWGLRARGAGWRLAALPAAKLAHELGDDAVLLPGRAQPVHVHGPVRNYYLARNTVWLIRQPGLAPVKWRVRYVWWLAKYVGFNALLADGNPLAPTPKSGTGDCPLSQFGTGDSPLSQNRRRRWGLLARGLRDGLRGRMGRLGR